VHQADRGKIASKRSPLFFSIFDHFCFKALKGCVESLSEARFRRVQIAALKAAGFLDHKGERVVETVKDDGSREEGNSSALMEKARSFGFR